MDLTEEERRLLIELLREEQRTLPSVIHHAERANRDELRQRRRTVEALLERLLESEARVR